MTLVLVVAVALIDKDNRVLLARRPTGKRFAGLWEFPGGKVKPGESPEVAVIREMREELAIETWDSCLAPLTFASHNYQDFHLLMPLFACRKWTGLPVAREHSEIKWVQPKRLVGYAMPEANKPLVAALRDWL